MFNSTVFWGGKIQPKRLRRQPIWSKDKKTLPQSEEIFGKTGAEWASMIWQKQFQEILTYWDCRGWKIVPTNTEGWLQCCMETVGPTISAVCKSAANRSKTWSSAIFAKKNIMIWSYTLWTLIFSLTPLQKGQHFTSFKNSQTEWMTYTL